MNVDIGTVAGCLLRLPLKALPKNKILRIRSGALKGKKWIVGSGIHGCWMGTYEIDKQQAIARHLKPGMVMYDIGANTGIYTLLCSLSVGVSGHVYAFEPFPQNVAYLISHTQLNGLRNVSILPMAVGADNDLVKFSVDVNAYENHVTTSPEALLSVPQLSIDKLLAGQGATPPDLIKIDVEGAEVEVLKGALNTLLRSKPILFLALHGQEQMLQCHEILDVCGYSLYDLQGSKINGPLNSDEIIGLHNSLQI